MNRPTIADLAKAANVSVSTVNRILAGSTSVRTATIERVQKAADEIGYYGLGLIEARKKASMPHYRLGFLLQQSSRELYQLFGRKVREAAVGWRDAQIEAVIEFVDQLDPENIATRLKNARKRLRRHSRHRGGPSADWTGHSVAQTPRQAGRRLHHRPVRSQSEPVMLEPTTGSSAGQQPGSSRRRHAAPDGFRSSSETTDTTARISRRRASGPTCGRHASHLTIDDSLPTHEEPKEAHRLIAKLLAEKD